MSSEKAREVSLRNKAQRLGLALAKDRARVVRVGHLGGYQLTARSGKVVAGQSWELSLSDVAEFLDAREQEILAARKASAS